MLRVKHIPHPLQLQILGVSVCLLIMPVKDNLIKIDPVYKEILPLSVKGFKTLDCLGTIYTIFKF